MQNKIVILGSTGSVGRSALRVARQLGSKVEILGLAAQKNIDILEQQAKEFSSKVIAVEDEDQAAILQKRLPHINILSGKKGLEEIAALSDANFVLSAISGTAGIAPTVAAAKAKKRIGLANKEVLVSGGRWFLDLAKASGASVIPVDSEHSAIFQCMQNGRREEVRRLIITASGGPFLKYSMADMAGITAEQALAHPVWRMGPKISIDSSTLMNKGLEVMEAHYLFDIPLDNIEVVVHPQSKVHSFVEYIDGSLIAQVADPDMALPIQYAITYPDRLPGVLPPFNFAEVLRWDFMPPDYARFPCLRLSYEALKRGDSYPGYLNAANEVLVRRFLCKEFGWLEIGKKLENLIEKHKAQKIKGIEDILAVDHQARKEAEIF